MPNCTFCGHEAEAVVRRYHPVHMWEVRVPLCEDCLCRRLQPLHEDDPVDEAVLPLQTA